MPMSSAKFNVYILQKKEYISTFFFAEIYKYFYLGFALNNGNLYLNNYVFNTEAHLFKKSFFDKNKAKQHLGF